GWGWRYGASPPRRRQLDIGHCRAADGEPAALPELVYACDFHGITLDRHTAAHQSALGRGAAHVEGKDVCEIEATAVIGAHQYAGGRSRFQRPHREASRSFSA